MSTFVMHCEQRVMMAADLSVSSVTDTIPKTLAVTAVGALKAVGKVKLTNVGPDAVGASEPAYVVKFFLTQPSGTNVEIGSVKAAKYAGLKKGASQVLSADLKLPALTAGVYGVYAMVEASGRGSTDTNALNDTATAGLSFTVPTPPVSTLASFGLGDKITFKATKLVTTGQGLISDTGKWSDDRGNVGTYSYIKSTNQIKEGLLKLTPTGKTTATPLFVTLTSIGNGRPLSGTSVKFTTAKAGAFASFSQYSSTVGNYSIYLKLA